RSVEEVLYRHLGLILVATLRRRLATVGIQPLNIGYPTKQAIASRRFGREQQPVNPIRVRSCKMLCVLGIAHDRATIRSFPGGSPEMDSHEISLVPVARKQDRMRHGFGSGANRTSILLNPSPICSQEQEISLWYL